MRRAEALQALRKLGIGNPELPLCIKGEILQMSIVAGDSGGQIARKMIRDEVNSCFFRDDDGPMVLRHRAKWASIARMVLLATTKLVPMELKLAMAVKPDDPAGSMRQAKLNPKPLTLNPRPKTLELFPNRPWPDDDWSSRFSFPLLFPSSLHLFSLFFSPVSRPPQHQGF